WYNGASEWNFSSGVNRNLTMIAEWDILSYAISLQSENTSWLTLSRSSVGVSHGVPQSVSVTSTPSDMIDSWSSTTGCIIITQSPLQMSCTQNATLTARFKRVAVTSAAISGASFDTLHTVGNTLQLSGAVLPSNAFDKSISWSSDNDDVASVSNGLVFANGIGEATITLHTSNNAVIAQKKIYVQTLSGSL
ncbi:MAG: Ig-like domain-containing protein, partial [Fibrobacterales bacterium]